MIPVAISDAADADLVAKYDYGADHFGEDAAERYLRSFDDALALIAEHPLIGALHDTVSPPIHGLLHGSHRIYYDVIDDRVVVRRILHAAMDAGRHFQGMRASFAIRRRKA